MNLIVAVDQNRGIGKDNKLLCHIPADMKFFREKTTGKVVVMGRKTLESFPGGKPLKNRTNIVLTTDEGYQADGAVLVHSPEELLEVLKAYESGDIFVIGGASVYHLLMPYCDVAYVTKINHAFEADTWFPELKEEDGWKMTEKSEEQRHLDLEYVFTKYERILE